MRILQIIDSLEVGGAETMAVNYANGLASRISFSGIAVTRKEGILKSRIRSDVNYFFLNKKQTIDFGAIFRLKNYCKQHKIKIIQAHSSSFFLACIVKFFLPRIKIIWHDHNGGLVPKREDKEILQIASFFFNGVISVNQELKTWAKKKLFCKNIIYSSNFCGNNIDENQLTVLKGKNGKRILSLANLRHQKNHFLLIQVAEKLKISHPDWTFHFVGKDFSDDYSKQIRLTINNKNLQENIFLYDSRLDTNNIIKQAEIAVFSSNSEGLPVSLLEFGLNKKAVLSTNIGEIPLIIKDNQNGLLSNSKDTEMFYEKLVFMIENEQIRTTFGFNLNQTIINNHSEKAVLDYFLNWIKTL